MQKALRYSAGLIGLYLVVAYATGSGKVLSSATAGGARLVEAFQGRSGRTAGK